MVTVRYNENINPNAARHDTTDRRSVADANIWLLRTDSPGTGLALVVWGQTGGKLRPWVGPADESFWGLHFYGAEEGYATWDQRQRDGAGPNRRTPLGPEYREAFETLLAAYELLDH